MSDATIARIQGARTVLLRAAKDMKEGQAKKRLSLALDALEDAQDAYVLERTQAHLELLADALTTPGFDGIGDE